jgi:pimeloyl-ACP methyl ester carboxylesterase
MMRHSPIAFRRTPLPTLVLSLLLPLTLLSACGSSNAATAPTATRAPTATATPESGTFYFTTDDNVTLSGKIVGTGTTAVVFSSMDGDPKIDWQDLAPLLASRGYMTFSYDYRGLGASQGYYDRSKIASDLNAAIQAAQQHGATKYILMGASLGGLVTLKVAAATHPTAVVALSAPQSFGGLDVSEDELRAITAPKFLAVALGDTGFANSMRTIYSLTPQPKELHIYSGKVHGSLLLEAPGVKDQSLPQLYAFLDKYAPVGA